TRPSGMAVTTARTCVLSCAVPPDLALRLPPALDPRMSTHLGEMFRASGAWSLETPPPPLPWQEGGAVACVFLPLSTSGRGRSKPEAPAKVLRWRFRLRSVPPLRFGEGVGGGVLPWHRRARAAPLACLGVPLTTPSLEDTIPSSKPGAVPRTGPSVI